MQTLKWKLSSMLFLSALLPAHAAPQHFPLGTQDIFISQTPTVRADILEKIAPLIDHSITQGEYPGAIIYVGHKNTLIYSGVFGSQAIFPKIEPMKADTIFDIASLTKVVATTPAIMQLIETAQLDLDAPVARYWPQWAQNGKAAITIRALLTHTSGLSTEMPSRDTWVTTAFYKQLFSKLLQENQPKPTPELGNATHRSQFFAQLETLRPLHTPGTHFEYSNLNFIVLAHVLEIVTGKPFDLYVKQHVFDPLHMMNTRFLPPQEWQTRIAPTEVDRGVVLRAIVQDPMTRELGGVSGAAGVFSTAADLGLYAESLLQQGRIAGPSPQGPSSTTHYLLSPLTILKMTTPQTPENMLGIHGLGWDLDSAYEERGVLLPVGSYGHTGYTGTSLWIDPKTQTWIVFLTSRLHPRAYKNNPLLIDRKCLANLVAASLLDVPDSVISNTSPGELHRAYKISP